VTVDRKYAKSFFYHDDVPPSILCDKTNHKTTSCIPTPRSTMTPKPRTVSRAVARRGRRVLEISHDASIERIVRSQKIFVSKLGA